MTDKPTLAGQRQTLHDRLESAKAANLFPAVIEAQRVLIEAATKAIAILDEALAVKLPVPGYQSQHAAIVQQLDAALVTTSAPLAPLRKPAVPLGAPAVAKPPAPRALPPKAPRPPRVPRGADRYDEEIPW